MSQIFKTVSAACSHVLRAVFVKAVRRVGLSSESNRIAGEVFLKGYRHATVARHVGVSRQRMHSICCEQLEEINSQLPPERATDEKLLLILITTATLGGCTSQWPLSMRNDWRTGTNQTPFRSIPTALICDDYNLQ